MAKSSNRITGQWHGHKFTVSSTKIMSFINLQLKGSSETEELIKGSEKFVKYKNAKPKEASFTVKLNAMLGCDVKKEALALVAEAGQGVADYLYIGRKKAMGCKLMLTEASVKEMAFTAGMKWLWADVAVTLKQSSTNDGSTDGKSTSSGGGGGGGGSTKKSGGSTKTPQQKAKEAVEQDKQRLQQERQQHKPGNTTLVGIGKGKMLLMER